MDMDDWLPSLNALRAFEAVSRHLSYRLAADELRVTPAAVKQLVVKLETTLDTPLVERRGRGLALTPAGVAGRDDLRGAFRQIATSVQKMRRIDTRQRLIVSVEPSFAAAWLVPRLESFKANNPDVDVLIDSSMQIIDLNRGVADIAIRYGVRSDGELVVHRLFDDKIFPVCSPSLAKGPPALKSLDDLGHVTLLHWDLTRMPWTTATGKWFDWKNWLASVGASDVEPGQGLRFNDYNLAVQAAVAGQGVVLGSWPILQHAVEAGLLVSPFSERVTTDIGYDLVSTPRAVERPEVEAFLNWMMEQASR